MAELSQPLHKIGDYSGPEENLDVIAQYLRNAGIDVDSEALERLKNRELQKFLDLVRFGGRVSISLDQSPVLILRRRLLGWKL